MEFVDLACMTQDEIMAAALSIEGARPLPDSDGGKNIFVRGGLPLVLVAHMDTVYNRTPLPSEIYQTGGMLSTAHGSAVGVGGDDRCGCWVLFQVARWDFTSRPSLLFCADEETCGAGSAVGLDALDWSGVKAFIEIDGPGFGVFYSDSHSSSVLDAFMSDVVGLHKLPSSYNDVSEICKTGNPAGVTLGAAYYNQHTGGSERVSLFGLSVVLDTVREICARLDLLGWSVVAPAPAAPAVGRGWAYDGGSYYRDFSMALPAADDDWHDAEAAAADDDYYFCACPDDCDGCDVKDACGDYTAWRSALLDD